MTGSVTTELTIFLADPRLTLLAGPQPGDPDPSSGKGPEWGKAAPVALLILVLLGIVLVFLLRSLNTHVKRVPASFDPPVEDPADNALPDASSRS